MICTCAILALFLSGCGEGASTEDILYLHNTPSDQHIAVIGHNVFLIGTDAEILRYDTQTGELETFCTGCYAQVLLAYGGMLYFGGQDGLCRLSPSGGEPEVLYGAGVPTLLIPYQGKLYFETLGGYFALDPDSDTVAQLSAGGKLQRAKFILYSGGWIYANGQSGAGDSTVRFRPDLSEQEVLFEESYLFTCAGENGIYYNAAGSHWFRSNDGEIQEMPGPVLCDDGGTLYYADDENAADSWLVRRTPDGEETRLIQLWSYNLIPPTSTNVVWPDLLFAGDRFFYWLLGRNPETGKADRVLTMLDLESGETQEILYVEGNVS